ncbi:MAG TPA: tautomerase family protein [Puia sp.]|nr:tautomerase family protein [Puia sp.]
MPLVTITQVKGRTAEQKKEIGEAIQAALVETGVPAADRFQRFIDLEAEDLIFDKSYPDLSKPRTGQFTMIEILLSVGRSVKVKKKILGSLVTQLKTVGIEPNDVFVVFKETSWENWAFANGEILHA